MRGGTSVADTLKIPKITNMKKNAILLACSLFVIFAASAGNPKSKPSVPAPIYMDNNYHGPADPEVVWNPVTKEYMIFYTGRRPFLDQSSYVGTPVGVAVSKDMIHWKHAGYCSFDGAGGEPDSEITYWAPGVIIEGDTAHMYVTVKLDSTPVWGGPSNIVHYTAPATDMISGWKRQSAVVTTPISIDATVIRNGDGYEMWYRDRPTEETGGLYHAHSKNLYDWELLGLAKGDINRVDVTGHTYQEGAFAFYWKGWFWIIADPHRGLAVYRSKDAVNWEYQGIIMYEPGKRFADNTRARHPSVLIKDNRAFIVYHVQPFLGYNPGTHEAGDEIYQKISFLQMAELNCENGKLTCNRDKTIYP